MIRRTLAGLSRAADRAAVAPALMAGDTAAGAGVKAPEAQSSAPPAAEERLQSEFLFDLVIERGPANNVGSPGGNRVVVPVAGGTFEGPGLKGREGRCGRGSCPRSRPARRSTSG